MLSRLRYSNSSTTYISPLALPYSAKQMTQYVQPVQVETRAERINQEDYFVGEICERDIWFAG
jgi:hypothetical protein